MTTWIRDELNRIGTAEELQIISRRNDGTMGNPVTIWVVKYCDDLYVRSVNGRTSAWFRGVQARHEGHIQAGGINKDVTFIEIDTDDIKDQIDAIYRAKYRRYAVSIIDRITSPAARAATIKLVPR